MTEKGSNDERRMTNNERQMMKRVILTNNPSANAFLVASTSFPHLLINLALFLKLLCGKINHQQELIN